VVGDRHNEQHRDLRRAAEFQRAYADAILAGEQRTAERIVREAIDAGLTETAIADRIIRPSLVLVGDLWAEGSISVADEHLATSITVRVTMLLREAFRVARQRGSRRILLAGAEGEHHVVGLELASSVIGHAGYDVRLLGADLPVAAITSAVARHRPSVVGFTSATVLTAVNLPDAFEAVRRAGRHIGIVVGGQGILPEMAAEWDVVVCRHVADAVEEVDALVQRARRN
jgi:MerR family transcriptional regulator, light-induced transcriptional regulator